VLVVGEGDESLLSTLPSLEKSSTTWTSPFSRAATDSGPASSSDVKLAKWSPWTFSRPGRQPAKVGHSGGPPRVSWGAEDLRLERVVRWYFDAVSLRRSVGGSPVES
jgi:hypothetical protein